MERVIFVEVLDRRGRVRERIRITAFPSTIGRAYSSDVILSDRFVSPTHAIIRASDDGGLVVEDAGSVNGMSRPGDSATIDRIEIESGLRVRLGETIVRFVAADHVVAPAEVMPTGASGLLEALKNVPLALGLLLTTLIVFSVDTYLGTYYDFSWSAVVGPAVLAMVALGFWGGVWAFANRLTTHRFDYLRHVAVACLASLGSIFLWPLSEYVEFWFSSSTASAILVWLIQAVLVTFLIYGHLTIIPASTPLRRRGWAVGTTAVVLGLAALFTYSEQEEFSSDVAISAPLKSMGADWVPAVSTEEFLERSRWTKRWVDEAASRVER